MAYSHDCKLVGISGMQDMCTLVIETEDEDRGRDKFLEGLAKAIKGFEFYSAGKEDILSVCHWSELYLKKIVWSPCCSSHTSFLVVYNGVKDGFLCQVCKRGGTDLHVAKLAKKTHFLQNQQFLPPTTASNKNIRTGLSHRITLNRNLLKNNTTILYENNTYVKTLNIKNIKMRVQYNFNYTQNSRSLLQPKVKIRRRKLDCQDNL